MKILITGGSGQVGQALLQTIPSIYEPIAPDRSSLNVEDLASLQQGLQHIAPDALINCAAYTAVDKAEEDSELAKRINGDAVKVMARYCKDHSIPMIQMSTDFVFDGVQRRPYSLSDKPKPLSEYGHSKLLGELAARDNCPDAYIVRSSWVYSAHGNNFVTTMLRLANQGTPLKIVDDQIGSPTCAHNLATFIWQVLAQRPEQKLLHCSDGGQVSWYTFAQTIFAEAQTAGLLSVKPDASPCTTEQYQAPALRPAYSVLDCDPSFAELGLQQIDWRVALHEMFNRRPAATGLKVPGRLAQSARA